jgi:SAM-dependent methyltransferase
LHKNDGRGTRPDFFPPPQAMDIEPLRELAEFTWQNAPSLCDPAGSCGDYHRVWSTIRVIDLASAAPAGRTFYEHGLAEFMQAGRPRVLISGGADTGLMAIAATAFVSAPARPHFVFADMCKTPVAQNHLFAEMAGLDAECLCADILALDVEPVDAVLAHNFLGFFDLTVRPDVVAAWSRLLKPGGIALITNNLIASADDPPKSDHRDEIAGRARQVRDKAAALGFAPDELDELERAARDFPFNRTRYRAPTEEEVRCMFADAGLAIELVDHDTGRKTWGPSTRGGADSKVRTAFMARKA